MNSEAFPSRSVQPNPLSFPQRSTRSGSQSRDGVTSGNGRRRTHQARDVCRRSPATGPCTICGIQQSLELHSEARGLPWLDILTQDLRFTFRTLKRDYGFTTVAVLIVALGIAANITVFSLVNTILLRPLPFRDSQQLVRIVEKNPQAGESSKTYIADATQDFQQHNHSFQSVSGYFAFTGPDNFKLIGNSQPVPVTGILVAESFFQTLGVEPSLGRLFKSQEFVKHAQPVALLSYPSWKRQFAGDHVKA